jgi:hypothetical protein
MLVIPNPNINTLAPGAHQHTKRSTLDTSIQHLAFCSRKDAQVNLTSDLELLCLRIPNISTLTPEHINTISLLLQKRVLVINRGHKRFFDCS